MLDAKSTNNAIARIRELEIENARLKGWREGAEQTMEYLKAEVLRLQALLYGPERKDGEGDD